jgi:ppGpp synthetase/RelA/SpoT-type nucleotidyltranferase
MDLNEYIEKRDSYSELAELVKNILDEAIRAATKDGIYKYHLQQIQHRAKTVDSLAARLQEYGLESAVNIEEIRGDLAGCRIIFYYNNDVNAFISSGIIFDLFKIDRDKIKVHGPLGPIKSANDEYTAIHYSVELKAEMLAESKYKKFNCAATIRIPYQRRSLT